MPVGGPRATSQQTCRQCLTLLGTGGWTGCLYMKLSAMSSKRLKKFCYQPINCHLWVLRMTNIVNYRVHVCVASSWYIARLTISIYQLAAAQQTTGSTLKLNQMRNNQFVLFVTQTPCQTYYVWRGNLVRLNHWSISRCIWWPLSPGQHMLHPSHWHLGIALFNWN